MDNSNDGKNADVLNSLELIKADIERINHLYQDDPDKAAAEIQKLFEID